MNRNLSYSSVNYLSAQHHPMEIFCTQLSKERVSKSTDTVVLPPGAKVRVAGCVVCRQAPGTAKGHVFITLEDEHGLINIILRPRVYEKYRQIARLEPMMIVEGKLQQHSGVVNVIAEHLRPIDYHQEELPQPMPVARVRNFA